MTPKFSKLTDAKPRRQITQETDKAFWLHLRRVLLSALREQGGLTETQYCRALELLRREQEGKGEK